MKLELTARERTYLIIVLATEYKKKIDRQSHAQSHGTDFCEPDIGTVSNILIKLDNK